MSGNVVMEALIRKQFRDIPADYSKSLASLRSCVGVLSEDEMFPPEDPHNLALKEEVALEMVQASMQLYAAVLQEVEHGE
jgi:hypothetical protein